MRKFLREQSQEFVRCPKKYLSLLGGFLVFIGLCTSPLGSSNSPYYLSYMLVKSDQQYARYANTIYASNFVMVFNALSATVSGLLKNKYHFSFKQMHFVGFIFYTLSQFATGFLLDYSFILFSIAYSVLSGIGLGMTFIVPISIVTKWFPENKGTATSILFVGFALGSTAFSEFATYYINPLDLSPNHSFSKEYPDELYFDDEKLLDRVPRFFYTCGLICVVTNILGSLLMFEKEESPAVSLINEEDGEERKLLDNSSENSKKKDPEYPTLTLKQALKLKELYVVAFIFSFSAKSISTYLGYYKVYGQIFIKDDHFLTFISVFGTFATLPGRVVWGRILDKISFKMVYMILITGFMVITFTLPVCEYFKSEWLYMLYFVISDLGVAGIMLTQPKVYINAFGHQNLVLTHGLIQFLGIPATLLDTFLVPYLLLSFGYIWTFMFLNVFSFISLVVLFCFTARDRHGRNI